jgi:hypothetical protein
MTATLPISLPLGRLPRDVSIYAAASGNYHLLWLDQTLPGETQLAASLVSSSGEVLRVPNVISNRPATTYSTAENGKGDLAIVWAAKATTPALYLQFVDSVGRVQQPTRLARSGMHPTATYDLDGRLHLLWLESEVPNQWTIHYASLAPDERPLDDTVKSTLIGVIQLNEGGVLTGFVAGVDAAHLYCLWTAVKVGQIQGGQLAGLAITIKGGNDVRTLTFDSLKGYDLRDLSIPSRPLPSLTIGTISSTVINSRRVEVPAAFVLTPEGAGTLRPVTAFQDVSPDPIVTLSRPTLSASPSGELMMTWSDLRENGRSNVYVATTR